MCIYMELIVLSEAKNKAIFQLKGADHTLCNAIRKELWNDKSVKAAGYTIRHPLVGIPRILVETDASETPQKAILEATKRLMKTNDSLKKLLQKELK